MSQDATGIWSAQATALTCCPVCKARKGVACDMAVEGYQEHNTHFARTEQPISARRSNAYRFPDDKYKKSLVAVGALGVLEGRTPAYVEAVAVDTIGRRWAWGEYGYEWPIDYDPSDVVMVPLPSLPTNHKKHVLLLGPEDLEALSGWDKPPTKTLAKFVSWLRSGSEKDMTLSACRLEGGAAWLATSTQSEAVLKYLARETLKQLQNEDLTSEEVERLAWHLQRCARGATAYMAHAAIAFESIERRDLSNLMERACTASTEAWYKAKRRACSRSTRWVKLFRRLSREGLKDALFCGSNCSHGTTLKHYLSDEEPVNTISRAPSKAT